MERPESKWRRLELAEELNAKRADSHEAAKAILADQQKTPEYKEAKALHRAEQQEMYRAIENIAQKRREIEVLKQRIAEIRGGIVAEEQSCGLEVLRKKYEYIIYLLYVNMDRRSKKRTDSMSKGERDMYDALDKYLPKEDVEKRQKPIIASPERQDFGNLSIEHRKEDSGKYTLNPETQDVDFENLPVKKIKIMQFDRFPTIAVALSGVSKNYSQGYLMPGVEFVDFLLKTDDDGNLTEEVFLKKITDQVDDRVRVLIFPGSLVSISSMWQALMISRDENNKWTLVGRLELTGPYMSELYAMVLIER